MTFTEIPALARSAVRARHRKEIDELDYRRQLVLLDKAGYSQREISMFLGISQPSVNSALRTAAKVPMPLDGFSGATAYEICQRYAGRLIERAQLVEELTRFPYVKAGQTDGYDSLIVDSAGTWSEVEDATRRGLIEDDIYEDVFNRRHGIAEDAVSLYRELATRDAVSQSTSAMTSGTELTRKIVAAIGGGTVTEKNGRIVIRDKAGYEIVIDKARQAERSLPSRTRALAGNRRGD